MSPHGYKPALGINPSPLYQQYRPEADTSRDHWHSVEKLLALDIFRLFEYIQNMIKNAAILAFNALAHEHRLKVFKMLIRKSTAGMSAGDIARRLGVPPSSLSFHLGQLERAGLVKSWRDQRRIIYAADIDGTRRVLTFLTKDCCDGRPEICGGLVTGNEIVAETREH